MVSSVLSCKFAIPCSQYLRMSLFVLRRLLQLVLRRDLAQVRVGFEPVGVLSRNFSMVEGAVSSLAFGDRMEIDSDDPAGPIVAVFERRDGPPA